MNMQITKELGWASAIVCLLLTGHMNAQSHCLTGCDDGQKKSTHFDPLLAEMAFDTLFARVNHLEAILDSLSEAGASGSGNSAFECGTSNVSYNGYDYRTVEIDGQCWFAENLRTANYSNGDAIATVTNASDWSNLTVGGQVQYDFNPINFGAAYGRLYNWYAVDDARGICPTGWHVPQDSEMPGGSYESLLASPEDDLPWSGTNSSGFSSLPGGRFSADGFEFGNTYGYFWTSTEISEGTAQWRGMIGVYYSAWGDKSAGHSIRCIQDEQD